MLLTFKRKYISNKLNSFNFLFLLIILLIITSSFLIYNQLEKKISKLDTEIIAQNSKLNSLEHQTPASPIKNSLKKMGNMDHDSYIEFFNIRSRDHLEFDFYTNNKNISNLSIEEINKLEQFCKLKTEQEYDKIYLSKAFNILAKIYNHRYASNNNIYKAIKNVSHALEIAYSPEYIETLSKSLTVGFEKKLPSKFKNLTPYITGKKEDEFIILNHLINLNIPEISARANYRLALINIAGRSSFNEPASPNFLLAIEQLNKSIKISKIKPTNIIDIVITVNNRHAEYAASVISSALLNSDPTTLYNFNFLMDIKDPISFEAQNKLSSMKWIRNYEINFINFPEGMNNLEGINKRVEYACRIQPHFTEIISYRLYLHNIFPNLNKIIYLDSDLLVLEDLNYFKKLNLNNYSIAGAIDICIPLIPRPACLNTFKEFYINSGVLVFNLDKMRKDNALEKMEKVATHCTNCDLEYIDQDILNLAFEHDKYLLSYRWNNLMLNRYYSNLEPEPISFIQHYSGVKPWSEENKKNFQAREYDKFKKHELEYWRYWEITPWGKDDNI